MSQNLKKIYTDSEKYDAMFAKFMFYFFKILGIFTVSYHWVWTRKTNSWNLLFKFSCIGIIYNGFFIFFIVSMSIIYVYFDFGIKFFKHTKQESFIFFLMTYLSRFNFILILLVFTFQPSKIVSIANKINELVSLVPKAFDLNKKLFIIYIGNFIVVHFLQTVLIYLTSKKVILDQLKVFIIYALYIQYTWILKIIEGFYKFINKNLQAWLLKHSKVFLDDEVVYSEIPKINELMFLHSFLYDLSQELSNFYSLPMILAIFNMFMYQLWSAFNFSKRLFIFDDLTYSSFLIISIFIYQGILSLVILVITVSNTVKEVNMMNYLLKFF